MLSHRQSIITRCDPARVSPAYEDAGLFKPPVQTYGVQLVPIVTRNTRDDVVLRGFQGAAGPFEVVFAGRRAALAADLIARLEAMKPQKKLRQADLEELRLDTHVEGAWRRRFWTDDSGWQDGIYQLVASRWAVVQNGLPERMEGERPAHRAPEVH